MQDMMEAWAGPKYRTEERKGIKKKKEEQLRLRQEDHGQRFMIETLNV